MEISGVGKTYAAGNSYDSMKLKKSEELEDTATAVSTDTFVKSEKTEESLQCVKRLSTDQIEELKAQHQANFDNLISQMMGKQAQYSSDATNIISQLPTLAETQEEAEAAISEDGDWGVNAVATRIMDMAVGLSGGDASKISILRSAVEKGFSQASEVWGGELPSVCNDTYEEISNRFDYWEENGSLEGYTME